MLEMQNIDPYHENNGKDRCKHSSIQLPSSIQQLPRTISQAAYMIITRESARSHPHLTSFFPIIRSLAVHNVTPPRYDGDREITIMFD